MAMNLNPEVGIELNDMLTSILDGTTLDLIIQSYQAAVSVGDNNISEGLKQKFLNIQNHYNDEVVVAINAVKNSLSEFTDFSEYLRNLQMENKVDDLDIGTHQGNNYSEAMSL